MLPIFPSGGSSFRASYGTLAWVCRTVPNIKETTRHCVKSILREPFKAANPAVRQSTNNLTSQLDEYAFRRPTSREGVENAISICRELLSREQLDGGYSQTTQLNLAGYIYLKHRITGDVAYLEEAAQIGHQAATSIPENDENKGLALFNLLEILGERYKTSNTTGALEQLIQIGHQVYERLPLDDPDRPTVGGNLRKDLTEMFERTKEIEVLKEAVAVAKSLIGQGGALPRDRIDRVRNLLAKKYERTSDLADLEDAILYARRVVDEAQSNSSILPVALHNLAILMSDRYSHKDELSDLEEAIRLSRQALTSDTPERANFSYNLSVMIRKIYERRQDSKDLTQALELSKTAIYSPDDLQHPQRARWLANHAQCLIYKYEATQSLEVLGEAIDYCIKAVEILSLGYVDRVTALDHLSTALMTRFERSGAIQDLRDAEKYSNRAILEMEKERFPDAHRLNTFSIMLARKYRRGGKISDLDKAIEFARSAVDAEPPNHANRKRNRGNLASWLADRYKANRDEADIKEALEINDLNEAIHHFSTVALDESAKSLSRIECAQAAAMLLSNKPDWLTAYKLIADAVKLLPTIGIRGLSWDDRQYLMRELSSVSSLAASVALEAHQLPSTALELQEAGRGIMSAAVIYSRSDLSDLKLASPDLYMKYREQRAATSFQLSQNERGPNDGLTTRSRNIRLLEHLEETIRETTPLKSFGLPLAPVDLMQLAGLGYIVSFNVSRYRSDAFLVTQNNIEVLRLPDLHYDELQNFVQQMPQLTRGSNPSDLDDVPIRNKALRKKLHWLWIVAVQPVLHAFNLTNGSRKGGHLPRLWWVMSGLMGQTPLHAAGEGWGKSANNTASHVISSYIPTFKLLANAQEKSRLAQKRKGFGIQVVAMPTSEGFDGLTFSNISTEKEIDAIRMSIRDQAAHVDVLQSPTKDEVINALPKHPAIHFACHGISDPLNPSNSSLLLADSELLTVREIADVSLPQARIAYLSACSTTQHGADDLRDEVLHVASAFQLVGFPHVLGTLWEADDGAAVRMAGLFYKELALQTDLEEGGRGNYTDGQVALAHHRAVEEVRNGVGRSIAKDVIKWATFVHLGC
ncbi:hypothetical protein L207DRAFT_434852 [Hyaloscypha variabilis F]|uniref:CHAT domain-containing protein n=1 Tax=Hyaloscypha variabilis (strain UAMH 11265 / GT02V1 / F) TaxID=1149755 RepID=A0A2J6RCR3_HYAVF|nr:hypothetical protein L207DRAFT_434852 [Hyaloscypha variabilis F]